MRVVALAILLAGCGYEAAGQAPGVPIYPQGRKESVQEEKIATASRELFATTNVLKLAEVKEQLKRTNCTLTLPPAKTSKLSAREVCTEARRSHLRLGWAYFCTRCDDWHVNLAGGYALTSDGAVATCYHVVRPALEIRDGCLIAVDDQGQVQPVLEVLAANRYSDVCIVRIPGGLNPLPLNTNVYPGDVAYCFSDPLDHQGYFSAGVVNRFYQFPGRRPIGTPPSSAYYPTRINVGTDWAPGSSGSAVLDDCGNAIGHVSTIAVAGEDDTNEQSDARTPFSAMIVFHEAVGAQDVLRLIRSRQ